MNSNTINLVGGVAIPALFVTLGAVSTLGAVDDRLAARGHGGRDRLLLLRRSGMGPRGGVLLIAAWAAFAAVQGIWG